MRSKTKPESFFVTRNRKVAVQLNENKTLMQQLARRVSEKTGNLE